MPEPLAVWTSMSWLFDRTDYFENDPDDPHRGWTASAELYADFVAYFRAQYQGWNLSQPGLNLSLADTPNVTAWGRALTFDHDFPAKHTAKGSCRALRLKSGAQQ
ncbi:hypothetical protein [Nocardioides sp. GXZ039]|uniref:hypothetical protein n=1 Tax=Nocardioides sp. GXZ039 TaxID=3136018 RepID=UPI0030F42A8C